MMRSFRAPFFAFAALMGACGGAQPEQPGQVAQPNGRAASSPASGAPADLGVFAPGTMRSEVDFDWAVREKARVVRSANKYWFALEVSSSGAVVLRVHEEARRDDDFMGPYTRPGSNKTTVQDHASTGAWKGSIVVVGGETRLRVSVAITDTQAGEQEFRCTRIADDPSGHEYVHCAPMHEFQDSPWKDPLPRYMRAPIVLAREGEGRVHARVSGTHQKQFVDVDFIP